MPLPISHKIAVIDDSSEEVASLLNTLSKNGLGFVHFTGELEQLPTKPLSGLRVVFSDIDLIGVKDEKSKISALLGVLKKVIAPTNGPYILIFWTKHSELEAEIESQWNAEGFPPLKYLCMEKADCKDENGDFSPIIIDQKIKEHTQSFQAFNFYLDWENALIHTGESFIDKFHNLVPHDKNWSHNIYYLLYRMFRAAAGNNEESYTPDKQFTIACRLFNKSFNNELDQRTTQISSDDKFPTTMKGKICPDQVTPAINHFLWVHNIDSASIVPGEVLMGNDDILKKNIIDRLFKGRQIQDQDVVLVKMIVTPACDIAQDKLLKNNDGNCLHRVVYAIILESAFVFSCRDAMWYYQFGPFTWHDKNVRMHFHFGTVGVEYISNSREKPCFTIKQEIVFDIQSKIANHMNRLGNSLLE